MLGWSFSPGRVTEGANVEGTTPMTGLGPAGEGRAGAVLAYRVEDIASAVAAVRAAGGTATDPTARPYALETDCIDDQGTPFHLSYTRSDGWS